MLVAAGASLTIRDTKGRTAMMLAFEVEDNDLASYLESKHQAVHFLFSRFISIIFQVKRKCYVLSSWKIFEETVSKNILAFNECYNIILR